MTYDKPKEIFEKKYKDWSEFCKSEVYPTEKDWNKFYEFYKDGPNTQRQCDGIIIISCFTLASIALSKLY